MPRATRLLIALSGLVVVAAYLLTALPNTAQSILPTPSHHDIDLTLTSIAVAFPQFQQTAEFLKPTRTAIAITRDSSLLTPSSATTIELTATQIFANDTATRLAYTPLSEGTLDSVYITATAIVIRATKTSEAITREPSLALTTYPTNTPGPCEYAFYNYHMNDFAREVEASLNAAGFVNADAGGFSTGVTEGERGCTTLYPLETRITVSVELDDLSDEGIANATFSILEVLSQFPRQETYGSKKARLIIFFEDKDQRATNVIDTGYNNALDAYAEGLRGDALIEALGGILGG